MNVNGTEYITEVDHKIIINRLERERDEAMLLLQRINDRMATDLNSDSEVASCYCNTKTPEIKHHKPGCKYRLIVERDEALKERDQLRKVADELAQYLESCAPDVPMGTSQVLKRYREMPHVISRKEPLT